MFHNVRIGITAAVLFALLAVALTWSDNTQAHAIIPEPTSKASYCSHGNAMWRCWCDEWLHYPICKRWHWHPR